MLNQVQGRTEKPQVSGIRVLRCHCCEFGVFSRKDTACDKALGFNAETEMCSCCRHFNPNEWEVADSCNDVLQRRMERVRITKEKALYSSQQAGLFLKRWHSSQHTGAPILGWAVLVT